MRTFASLIGSLREPFTILIDGLYVFTLQCVTCVLFSYVARFHVPKYISYPLSPACHPSGEQAFLPVLISYCMNTYKTQKHANLQLGPLLQPDLLALAPYKNQQLH